MHPPVSAAGAARVRYGQTAFQWGPGLRVCHSSSEPFSSRCTQPDRASLGPEAPACVSAGGSASSSKGWCRSCIRSAPRHEGISNRLGRGQRASESAGTQSYRGRHDAPGVRRASWCRGHAGGPGDCAGTPGAVAWALSRMVAHHFSIAPRLAASRLGVTHIRTPHPTRAGVHLGACCARASSGWPDTTGVRGASSSRAPWLWCGAGEPSTDSPGARTPSAKVAPEHGSDAPRRARARARAPRARACALSVRRDRARV